MRPFLLLLRLDARRRMRTFGVMLARRSGGRQPLSKGRYGCTYGFVTLYMTGVFFWIQTTVWGRLLQDRTETVISWQLLLTLLVCLLGDAANRDLFAGDWDLEWLLTLPVSRRTLMGARALQRGLFNPLTRLLLWPSLTVLCWHFGYRWSAPLAGLALTLPLAGLVGYVLVLFETTARLRLPPARLRNLGGILSILGILSMYLSMAPTLGTTLRPLVDSTGWLPWELPARALLENGGFYFLLLLEWVAFGVLVQWLLERLLSQGLVQAGVRERTGSPRAARRLPFPPVIARELRLLARDRVYLVNAMLLPFLILAAQLLANRSLLGAFEKPSHTGALAFGMGSYALMFSAFQMLTREGQSLWLLYTVPVPLEQVLRQKAYLWAGLASFYALLILGGGWWHQGLPHGTDWLIPLEVLAGLPLMAVLATCLGAEAIDLSDPVVPALRVDLVYLYLTLVSLYGTALVLGDRWYRFVMMLLVALLALACWQKLRDRLPYLLDPSARPRALTLADGLLAALAFFVLQVVSLLSWSLCLEPFRALAASYATAGALAYLGTRLVFRQRQVSVPAVGGLVQPLRAVGLGLACAAVGGAWLALASRAGWLEGSGPRLSGLDSLSLAALYALAVLTAPLFEEFLFRGLIYGGLRRFARPGLAAAGSALVFAVVHPPLSVLPVFLLGLVTATLYERTQRLSAPMLTHAVYNCCLLTANVLVQA